MGDIAERYVTFDFQLEIRDAMKCAIVKCSEGAPRGKMNEKVFSITSELEFHYV